MHFLMKLMLLSFFIVSGSAYSAAFVTFDGGFGLAGPSQSIQRQDFSFTTVSVDSFIEVGSPRDLGGLYNANNARFEMSAVSSDPFDLFSFELSRRQNDVDYFLSASSIDVIGSLSGGGSVSFNTGALTSGFSTILLPTSFVNLTSVAFNPIANNNSNRPQNRPILSEFVIDNLRTVPEPSSIALIGMGLIGIGLRRVKKVVK